MNYELKLKTALPERWYLLGSKIMKSSTCDKCGTEGHCIELLCEEILRCSNLDHQLRTYFWLGSAGDKLRRDDSAMIDLCLECNYFQVNGICTKECMSRRAPHEFLDNSVGAAKAAGNAARKSEALQQRVLSEAESQAMLQIIHAIGDTLVQPRIGNYHSLAKPQNELPFPRQLIDDALLDAYARTHNETQRKHLGGTFGMLAWFVPDKDYAHFHKWDMSMGKINARIRDEEEWLKKESGDELRAQMEAIKAAFPDVKELAAMISAGSGNGEEKAAQKRVQAKMHAECDRRVQIIKAIEAAEP